jgi:tRNA (guanine-N7-)-methyltransferase
LSLPALFALDQGETPLRGIRLPFDLDALVPGSGAWEVELGFGKGRFLVERAGRHPERRFLGIEIASKYYRLTARRARRRGLGNVLVVRGEALYLLATVFPPAFAAAVHVYFPDPWPKSRHHKRRLFDPETVDLVVGLLAPGGELSFATDHPEYGELVAGILAGVPGLAVERLPGPWPEGARTNYEAKFMAEGREVLRLRAKLDDRPADLHPGGRCGILVAPRG